MNATLIVSASERRRRAEVDALFHARSTHALIDRLDDPSWAVRRAVVSALARLGDDAVDSLCDVLKRRRDHEGRIAAAVDALVGSLGHVEPAAFGLLESSDGSVASDGAQILGRRRCAAALPRLAQLANGTDDNVAMAAIEAIGRIGGEGAIDLLIAAIQSGSFFRAFPAIDVLGRTGDPSAVAPLAALLGDPRYAIEAARALGSSGQPLALPPLSALLVRPNDAEVRVAAAALVEIGDRYTERFGPNRVVGDGIASIDAALANRRVSHALLQANPSERTSLCRVLGLLGVASAVPSLVELLDAEPEAAQAAAAVLSSLSRDAEPYLVAALRDSTSERRLLLLPIVGRRPSARQEVLSCLRDDNSGVRALACDALAKLGDTDAVGDLFGLLRDSDARVSQAAVAAIEALGGNETEKLALAAAASTEARERRSGLRILSYFGWPSALATFLVGMDDADERIRDLAAIGLAAIDDERSLGALVAAAHHASPRTRAAAIRALGYTRSDGAVRDCVRQALGDADAWVRYYACQALSRLKDEAAAAAIADLMDDPAGHVRVAVIEALARLRGESALDALHGAAGSPDCDVRRAALLGLGSVRNRSSLPYLQAGVQSPDAATRLVALSALSEFDGQDPVSSMASAMSDPDEGVRGAAIALLAMRSGPQAANVLIERLTDPALRERVVGALSQPAEGRVAAILVALRGADFERAQHLVSALARARRADALAAIEEAFTFDNVFARRAAAPALAALGEASSRKLLDAAAANDPDTRVRRVAAAYLGRG